VQILIFNLLYFLNSFYFSQNFFIRTITITAIPKIAIPNKISAILSQRLVQMKLVVLIDAKENITEMQSKTATILAISSIMEFEVAELKCNEVMTIKQKPSKLAAVGRMC